MDLVDYENHAIAVVRHCAYHEVNANSGRDWMDGRHVPDLGYHLDSHENRGCDGCRRAHPTNDVCRARGSDAANRSVLDFWAIYECRGCRGCDRRWDDLRANGATSAIHAIRAIYDYARALVDPNEYMVHRRFRRCRARCAKDEAD